MIRSLLLLATVLFTVGFALPAPAQIGPATRGACFLVRNMAPFALAGRVVMKSRQRYTFVLQKGQSRRACIEGEMHPGDKVELVITVFAIPLFVCYTQVDQPIQLFAVRQEEGYKYYADCR
ncbi:MAG: hypothetical protein EXQ95_09745 [Alphaproteobacteria bacterium]|nr:hypothetical protein [Alphaproteobacteria bacterium]